MRGQPHQHHIAAAWLMKLLRQVLLLSLVPFFTATAQAVSVEYAYDGAYNRTDEFTRAADSTLLKHLKYHYDAAGRLTLIENVTDPSQSETLGYDDNGNQISRTVGMQQTLYGFDARDQLVSVEKRADSTPPVQLARYRYNADGMRVDGEEEGQARRYSWDDDQLILTREPDNTLSRYQWGPNRLANLVSTTGGVTRRDWYFFDSLGSITALVSDSGALSASYRFNAFGEITAQTGDTHNRFTFTGHQFDEVSALYYFKARYYDPGQGRFVSEDSYEGVTATPESRNGYLYANANPLIYIDQDGHIALLANGRDMLLKADGWLAGKVAQYNDSALGTAGMIATTVTRGLTQGGAGVLSVANAAGNTISSGLGQVGLNSAENMQAHWQELRASAEIASSLVQDVAKGGDSQVYQKARATVSYAYEGDKRALSDIGAAGIGMMGGGEAAAPQKMAAAANATAQVSKKVVATTQAAVNKAGERVRLAAIELKTQASRLAENRTAARKSAGHPDAPAPESTVRVEAHDAPDVTNQSFQFSGGTPILEGSAFNLDVVNLRSAEFYRLYGDNPLRGTMSNLEARQWYLAEDAQILNRIDPTASLEVQARQAFDMRNANRSQAREFMSDRVSADRLIREEPNMNWEQMVQLKQSRGLSGDDIYQSILQSSQKTRVEVNRRYGLE